MAEIKYEHPLKLPSGWHSTPPSARVFNTSFPRTLSLDEALRFLTEEIHHYPFSAAAIYTNFQHITNDRLRKKVGNDTSAASVMLKCFGREHMLACDHWQILEHNIYALHLALRAVRNMEEWAIATKSYALSLFSGNITAHDTISKGTEGDASGLDAWMLDLGLGPTATLEDANAVYRRRARDLNEEEDAMLKLNQSIEEARKHLR